MNRLEGASCAGLPGFVVDKYFDCNTRREPLKKAVALAICGRCVVMEVCRNQALNGPKRDRGVIGGVTVFELNRARAWRSYEQGVTERVPIGPRPGWLQMTEAAQLVEQQRLENDADEPPIER